MSTLLNPYISFRDNAREALEYYQSVFGGELALHTFEGMGDMGVGPDELTLIMHGQLTTAGGMTLMASDTPSFMGYEAPSGAGITISLSGEDEDELERFWAALADGGTITLPFEVAPWGDRFGMITDRFGVDWMFNSGSAPAS